MNKKQYFGIVGLLLTTILSFLYSRDYLLEKIEKSTFVSIVVIVLTVIFVIIWISGEIEKAKQKDEEEKQKTKEMKNQEKQMMKDIFPFVLLSSCTFLFLIYYINRLLNGEIIKDIQHNFYLGVGELISIPVIILLISLIYKKLGTKIRNRRQKTGVC